MKPKAVLFIIIVLVILAFIALGSSFYVAPGDGYSRNQDAGTSNEKPEDSNLVDKLDDMAGDKRHDVN